MDMPSAANAAPHPVRRHVVNSFAMVEDVVYVGLGVLLAAAAIFLLISGGVLFVQLLTGGELGNRIVDVLDRLLLILLIIECSTPCKCRSASTGWWPSRSWWWG